jgi:Predicted membrane protein, hemolysin III homolog
MNKRNTMKENIKLSFGEEIGNSVSHGASAIILLFLLPFSSVFGYMKGGIALAVGISIFVISIILMLLTSCIYHFMPFDTKHKYVMRILDHSMIFVAIAGTYTPILVYLVKGSLGYGTLIFLWICVVLGILYKAIVQNADSRITLVIYLSMGWTAVILLPKLFQLGKPMFLSLIALGGILYTIGTYFYSKKTIAYFHFIWHIFIILAVLSHYIAIVFFI